MSPVFHHRVFCDGKKQTGESGTGGSAVQGAGFFTAGQAGFYQQG